MTNKHDRANNMKCMMSAPVSTNLEFPGVIGSWLDNNQEGGLQHHALQPSSLAGSHFGNDSYNENDDDEGKM